MNVRRLGRDFATCLEGRDFRISNSLLVLPPLLALPLQFLTTQITNNRTIEGLRERTEHLEIFLLFRPSLNGVVFPMFCLLVEGEYLLLLLLLSAVTHAPFHASVLRPTSCPMHETAGMGKLINAALLSLMRHM